MSEAITNHGYPDYAITMTYSNAMAGEIFTEFCAPNNESS